MERLSRFAIMPEHGEILDHEEVFGIKWGEPGRKKISFGDRRRPDDNPAIICIRFRTPGHTELGSGYSGTTSNMDMLAGKRRMVFSTVPYDLDNEDAIAATNYPWGGDLTAFVSDEGVKDPGGPRPGHLGHDPLTGKMVILPASPRPGLKDRMEYFCTYGRTDRTTGPLPPLTLMYIGSDDGKSGGEVIIVPDDIADGGVSGIPMTFGDMTGLFIPDN